uniref:FLYWCH-type domain-containing protein n=1 Tax=Panagrellus redivivus TaxID=6233 RepID=A0A7E4VDQ9_PANRE
MKKRLLLRGTDNGINRYKQTVKTTLLQTTCIENGFPRKEDALYVVYICRHIVKTLSTKCTYHLVVDASFEMYDDTEMQKECCRHTPDD